MNEGPYYVAVFTGGPRPLIRGKRKDLVKANELADKVRAEGWTAVDVLTEQELRAG